MGTATYWQRGEVIDYTNATEAVIAAGQVLKVGDAIGVAASEIPIGAKGAVHIEGVFQFAKKKEDDVKIGTVVYYIAADGNVSTTKGELDGDVRAGHAVEDAGTSAETVLVKINV